MTTQELDRRVAACAQQVRELVHEISTEEEIEFDRAVALGVLLSCSTLLGTLSTPPNLDQLASSLNVNVDELAKMIAHKESG